MIPRSEEELMAMARRLNGMTAGELAAELNLPPPGPAGGGKGYVGRLAETALGASAGSKPYHDFAALGVELKTIPLLRGLTPAQNTRVCVLERGGLLNQTFENSNFYNKIRRVLWLPVEGDPALPPAGRRFGAAFLWSPGAGDLAVLRREWEEIAEAAALEGPGGAGRGSAGFVLLAPCGSARGERRYAFYLGKNFTKKIVADFLAGRL